VTIDRGTIHSTKIGDGTKIDNLVHIAHNVEIGQHCLIVAQVGISGSVKIGDRVTLAGQAGVVGHLKIGNDTVVAARSVVMNNIEGEKMVSGFPAIDHKEQMRIMAATKKLPEMLKYYKNNKKKG
jgi:UDP-3-O-[3-hydroxymyristoyl] glucosamine N-acyltransferase